MSSQKNAIVFYNQGELDIRAVTTFGLSVKKTDNPIGYFGTGLKYAIAVLLREGCEIEIFSGEESYNFKTEKDSFRGEECDLIFMNGDNADHHQLPFTMALGRNWELWQAYRELYCNAIDEKGGVCDKHKDASGKEGSTIIAVRGEAFVEVHKTKNSFINADAPLMVSDSVDIVPTPGAFLKGIKIASNIYYQTLFGYNFHGGITLTEDRTLKHDYEAEGVIKKALFLACDFDLISDVLKAAEGSFEQQISWAGSPPSGVGETFKRVLFDLAKNQPSKISESAKELAKALDSKKAQSTPHKLSKAQKSAYLKACTFLFNHGVDLKEYPVEFVQTLGEGIWGQAKEGKILISAECFAYGTKSLVATLYEEHLHLKTGMHDLTRNMQNHLFHTIIGLFEEADGACL